MPHLYLVYNKDDAFYILFSRSALATFARAAGYAKTMARSNTNERSIFSSNALENDEEQSQVPYEKPLIPPSSIDGETFSESYDIYGTEPIPSGESTTTSISNVKLPKIYAPKVRVQRNGLWHPGFWARFPVLVITALAITLICV